MTKSEFQDLQMKAATSGMTIKTFPRGEGVAYSTYNYWCRKMKSESEALPIAPISIRSESRYMPDAGTAPSTGVPEVMVACLCLRPGP